MSDNLRKIGRWLALGMVGFSVFVGLQSGISDLPLTVTTGQRVVSLADLVMGAAGGASLIAYWKRARWGMWTMAVWAAAAILAASVAPVAWGGSEWWTGLLAGLGTALVVALVMLAWRGRCWPARSTE